MEPQRLLLGRLPHVALLALPGAGGLLLTQPYRLAPHLAARVRLPADPRSLLPGSSAPVVLHLRADAPVRPGGGGT